MNFWHEYPYTDFHELNLSWILKKMRQIDTRMTDFEAVNKFKFYGDWQITKSYPIWSIVSGEDDNGYLAIQNVPAGITLDNEDYWVKVANYSALYADVQRRIIAVEKDNEQLHEDNTQLHEDITETVELVNTTADTLRDEMADIRAEILKVLNYRKVIIFGDSYTDDAAYSRETFTQALTRMLAAYPLIQFQNFSLSSCRFSANLDTSYKNRINAVTSSFNSDEVTDVIILGGFNDRNYTIDEIQAGISAAVTNAHAKYPNARVSVGHYGWSGALPSEARELLYTRTIPAYRSAPMFGAAYMTNIEYTMHDYELFDDDRVHPNAAGNTEIARQVSMYILNNCCDVHYKYRNRHYSNMSYTATEYDVGSALDNDLVTIWFPGNTINFTSNTRTIANSSFTQWMQMTDVAAGKRQMFIGSWDTAMGLLPSLDLKGYLTRSQAPMFVDVSGITWVLSGGFLYAENKNVGMSSGDGWVPTTNIGAVQFAPGSITIPTLWC